MRVLKSGEVKYKNSAFKESIRLSADPLPMTVYYRDEKVKVYMGCGWSSGQVRFSDEQRCTIFLTKEQRMVSCVDNRNLIRGDK